VRAGPRRRCCTVTPGQHGSWCRGCGRRTDGSRPSPQCPAAASAVLSSRTWTFCPPAVDPTDRRQRARRVRTPSAMPHRRHLLSGGPADGGLTRPRRSCVSRTRPRTASQPVGTGRGRTGAGRALAGRADGPGPVRLVGQRAQLRTEAVDVGEQTRRPAAPPRGPPSSRGRPPASQVHGLEQGEPQRGPPHRMQVDPPAGQLIVHEVLGQVTDGPTSRSPGAHRARRTIPKTSSGTARANRGSRSVPVTRPRRTGSLTHTAAAASSPV
jgi:hypothetical protein